MTHAVAGADYAHTKATRYADPGYQSDGKKRYALDSEEQCRAAWSYINQAGNASKYTPKQLARVKARIKAAGHKYGIEFSDKVEAAALTRVEVARPGRWKLSTGELEVTARMLDDAARFAARPEARPGYLTIGHKDSRFREDTGEPALGWLHNLRVEDDDGPVLVGDLADLPEWLATAIPRHWPDRSMEGYANYQHDDGQTYGLVVEGLALLGVTPPGMESLRSLRQLPAALGVAASGTRVVASMSEVEASAPEAAEEEHDEKKGAGMDPAKIREALGLSADASDDDVRTAFVAGLPPSETTPPGDTKPPTPVAAAAPGTMMVDASAWQEREERLKNLEAQEARRRREERDAVISTAVQAGKFAPSRREHWVRLWDADPEGTRQVIDGLTANLIPVAASGYDGDGTDGLDDEFKHLFPPAHSSKEA